MSLRNSQEHIKKYGSPAVNIQEGIEAIYLIEEDDHYIQAKNVAHMHLDDFSMEYVIQQVCTKQTTLLCMTFIDAQYAT